MEFINTDYCLVSHSNIIEWDIRHANTSLMRFYKLAQEKTIDKLDKMPKQEREVKVGLLCREDPTFSKKLQKSFDDIMKLFLTSNELTKDDIISIKKDACFVLNHPVEHTTFDNLEFVKKNSYSGYCRIPLYEFYIKSDGEIDVKGIGDKTVLSLHRNGILQFVFDVVSVSSESRKFAADYLHQFIEAYKKRELPFDYYREFNSQSAFMYYAADGSKVFLDEIDESVIDTIDISWNYINIILPLARLLI